MVERNDTNIQSNRMNKDAKCYIADEESIDVAVQLAPANISDESSDTVVPLGLPDPDFKYRYSWTGMGGI